MEFATRPYGVYIKTDEQNRITAINSSAFLQDVANWMKIDEGYGDKHHHAQGNYLNKPLMDDRGICRYKLVDGKPVERTQEEMDADYTPPVPVPSPEERLAALEQENAYLKETLNIILEGVTEDESVEE